MQTRERERERKINFYQKPNLASRTNDDYKYGGTHAIDTKTKTKAKALGFLNLHNHYLEGSDGMLFEMVYSIANMSHYPCGRDPNYMYQCNIFHMQLT